MAKARTTGTKPPDKVPATIPRKKKAAKKKSGTKPEGKVGGAPKKKAPKKK